MMPIAIGTVKTVSLPETSPTNHSGGRNVRAGLASGIVSFKNFFIDVRNSIISLFITPALPLFFCVNVLSGCLKW
jgi:hypothetical protein